MNNTKTETRIDTVTTSVFLSVIEVLIFKKGATVEIKSLIVTDGVSV